MSWFAQHNRKRSRKEFISQASSAILPYTSSSSFPSRKRIKTALLGSIGDSFRYMKDNNLTRILTEGVARKSSSDDPRLILATGGTSSENENGHGVAVSSPNDDAVLLNKKETETQSSPSPQATATATATKTITTRKKSEEYDDNEIIELNPPQDAQPEEPPQVEEEKKKITTKVRIGHVTLGAMRAVSSHLPLPATVHTLANAWLENRAIMYHHASSREEEDEDDVKNEASSSSSVFPSKLASAWHDAKLGHSLKERYVNIEEEGDDVFLIQERRKCQLHLALTQLINNKSDASSCSSSDRVVKSWDVALEILSEVVILPPFSSSFPSVKKKKKKDLEYKKKVPFKKQQNTVYKAVTDRKMYHKKRKQNHHHNGSSVERYLKIIQDATKQRNFQRDGRWKYIGGVLKMTQSTSSKLATAAAATTTTAEASGSDSAPSPDPKHKSEEQTLSSLLDRLDAKLDERISVAEVERSTHSKLNLIDQKAEFIITECELRQKKEELQRQEQKRKEEEEEKARQRASALLHPLTPEELTIVESAVDGSGPPHEIIARIDNDTVQRESMSKLQPGKWLNDEIIHYFLLVLSKRDEEMCRIDPTRSRSHFFKSFFVTKLLEEGGSGGGYKYSNVKRWSKRVPGKDIFGLDKIFFPINVGGVHWTCAVVFMREKRIQYYDSMGGDGRFYLEGLMRYLKDEHAAKKGKPLPGEAEWSLVECTTDTPQQKNGYDCGVFTCMFADFLSKDCPLSFSQMHVSECRRRIALSIMKGIAIS